LAIDTISKHAVCSVVVARADGKTGVVEGIAGGGEAYSLKIIQGVRDNWNLEGSQMQTYWDQRLFFQPPAYFLPYILIIEFPEQQAQRDKKLK
jgi:hypothetical protein